MPYTPEHKRETHQKMLESARRLFNRNGFSEVPSTTSWKTRA
jgi:hypothetical protein